MNRNFGKLIEAEITYAPSSVVVIEHHVEYDVRRGVIHPTAADYLAAENGPWKAVVDVCPTEPAPEGHHYERDGWSEDTATITRTWKVVEDPKVYRTFSKLKIYGAIATLDAVNSAATWAKVQAWLEGKTVNGVNGWMAFQLAQEISEDHPLFAAWSEEARQLLGLTPEQFETLLNQCILEG